MSRERALELLDEIQNRLWQDVFVYSDNYAMTRPREGMEDKWTRARDKAKMMDLLIAAIHAEGLDIWPTEA